MAQLTPVGRDVFRWSDSCNVYVVREGDKALLIDLGDGGVLDALPSIGVKAVEWVLFTHHHREQCQGARRLAGLGIHTACAASERAFFENPKDFRKMRPALDDAHAVYGASYVRPPIEPIPIDRVFAKMDDFTWRGREFVCLHTGGNSPGHMSYMLRQGGKDWLAFSGDLMLDGAKMHTWFDTEWDYGFAKGLYELGNSAALIAGYGDVMLLPSHGPVVRDGRGQLAAYVRKLRRLAGLYVRGYDISKFAGCDQDMVSRPTAVPHIWQVTPHLYKFRGPEYWPNFHLLMADNGHAIAVDCGLFDRSFLDAALTRMKERLGLKAIDAVFVTHMHGDHGMDAGHLRQKHGAKLWAMEGVADKFERPFDHDLAALLPMYKDRNKPDLQTPLKFDRVLRDGEVVQWEGYTLVCDWMPGQTKHHSCLHGVIDGRRVAFTGDNIFAAPGDPAQGGNEAVVARNEGTLEEGYLYAANYLHTIAPDLILGGHGWAIDQPAALIARLRIRMEALREAFTDLSVEADYRYMFDPYVFHAKPYRVVVQPGRGAEARILIRNYGDQPQTHRVAMLTPEGLTAEPAMLEGSVPAQSVGAFAVRIQAHAKAKPGLHMVAMDVARDGLRLGAMYDFIVWVGDEP